MDSFCTALFFIISEVSVLDRVVSFEACKSLARLVTLEQSVDSRSKDQRFEPRLRQEHNTNL